jgi:hypothetical protein
MAETGRVSRACIWRQRTARHGLRRAGSSVPVVVHLALLDTPKAGNGSTACSVPFALVVRLAPKRLTSRSATAHSVMPNTNWGIGCQPVSPIVTIWAVMAAAWYTMHSQRLLVLL